MKGYTGMIVRPIMISWRGIKRHPLFYVASGIIFLSLGIVFWTCGQFIWLDYFSLPLSQYSWPLDVDIEKVIKEYRQGAPSVQPINVDRTSIVVFPDQKLCDSHVLVTVLIKTKVQDRHNRDLLRRTWIKDLPKNNMRHAFLMGQCTSMKCITSLADEMSDHKDLVQGDFIDAYYNNTLKFSIGLKYIAYHCNKTRYTLIIDGDYSLNPKRLAEYLRLSNFPKDMYAGKLWPASRPFRWRSHKQYLSYEFYPFRYFPPFIAAGASLLSAEIVEPLHIIARYTKFVPFDDVFYGMVARKLNISLTDASYLLPSWWSVPSARNKQANEVIIGSHRFGDLEEVERIYELLHSGDGS